MIRIRPMHPQDIPAGMRLQTVAGWNQTEEDWHLFFSLSPGGCYVATAAGDGSVVGTVITLPHGDRVAWISMLLVDPAYRRRRVGTRLMQRAIEHLSAFETVKLDATPPGRPLYERLGFRDEYGLLRLMADVLPAGAGPIPAGLAAPVTDQALRSLLDLDGRAFGADRGALLRALWRRTPELAWYVETDGRVRGFCLGRRGTAFVQLGPVVAETQDDALAVCQRALQGLAGQSVALDVPASQEGFLACLRECGFVARRSFTRMFLGENGNPGIVRHQFAIAGPELG